MNMWKLFWLPAIALALLLSINAISAEQILLSDGRYLQGTVVEVKDDGFTFKLTESGGQVFLRWNQVDAALKKRLTNQKDPDEGLNLEVMVAGARLELIDGTVYEGEISQVSNGYRVKNFELTNGKVIPDDEVMEEGFIKDIQIEATVMLAPKGVLTLAEEQRAPLETARQFYELARIADKLALYQEAMDYVTLGRASGPDAQLQARLTQYDTELDELIRQAAVLDMLVKAREQAKKKVFQVALNILTEAKDTFKPTGLVLTKVDETYEELDIAFTKYLFEEWYKQMKPVATAFLKLKENKEILAGEAANWARRQMDIEIAEKLAMMVGSEDPANIKERFMKRFDWEKETDPKLKVRLGMKKVSFGETGFYTSVGGHLEIGGKKATDDPTATPPRGPRDRDDVSDPADGFQQGNKNNKEKTPKEKAEEEGNDSTDDIIKEALKRAQEMIEPKDDEKDVPKAGQPDVNKLREEAPSTYPSLDDWWAKTGTTTRAKWMCAVYVINSGTMTYYDWHNWDVKFK
jgi:hypothetical protein